MMTKAVKPGMVISAGVWRDNLLVLQQNTVLTTNIIRRLADWGINTVRVKAESCNNWGNDCRIENIKDALAEDEIHFIQQYTKAVKLTNELFERMREDENLPYEALRNLATLDLYQLAQGKSVLAKLYKIKPFTDYTSRHAVDTGIIAGVLGRWLNLPIEQTKILVLCGLMHDIGKSQISRAILEKPGNLTCEERKTINLHPEYGYYMAKNIPGIISAVLYAILQHHERENGEGYPNKLVSRNIHPVAKIVAVADVYDAMTTERIYQKSVTPFTALETLIEDMFIRLDKECCKVLIRNICRTLIGSVVMLSDGSQAEVVQFSHFMSAKPVVSKKTGVVIDLYFRNDLSIVEVIMFNNALSKDL
ncbi:MAG: rpfG 14 [Firmicutes bacterium]|nr:rpfG 14 [Bacillota bacterium]